MAKEKELDEKVTDRRPKFEAKSKSASNKKNSEAFSLEETPENKIVNNETTPQIKQKRVRDLLNSFSKFDEDILRLQGLDNKNSETVHASINELSVEEMQNELQEYLLERDKIKLNLDNLVQRVNQTSSKLEKEEEKIQNLSQQLQIKLKKEFSNLVEK